MLSGELSSATAGQTVEVLATSTTGGEAATSVASTTTTAGGEFRVAVRPTVGTIYRVRWGTTMSGRVKIGVRPRIGLGVVSVARGVFTAKATAQRSYAGRVVWFQRRGQFGQWVSLKRVRLDELGRARFQATAAEGRLARARVHDARRRPGRATWPGSARRGSSAASAVSDDRDGRGALCSPAVSFPRERSSMSTLAFQFEEITARELKPALFELDGISRATVEAHYKLYQGYVDKRNEILGKLAAVDLESANQVYSELRALKVELSFAIGGIKNHEIYFEHLGGEGGDPDGSSAS